MPRVLVIHYKPPLAEERARRLRDDGLQAEAYPAIGPKAFRTIRANPPDAILIDLTEMPSYGRVMGALLREQKGTRAIPLVFLKGDPEKNAKVKAMLPDAEFASWPNVAPAIERAIRRAPAEPATPRAPQVPLAQKLRIRGDSEVAVFHAPPDFDRMIGELPPGVRVRKQVGEARRILFFAKSTAVLRRELPAIAKEIKRGRMLWICWPKRTSNTTTDLTANVIRDLAASYNLAPSMLCSMDETWSAMAFGIRIELRGQATQPPN